MNSSHCSMARLREEAEAILEKNPVSAPEFKSADARKLIHELQVYEIELEMQNEELRAANLELVDSNKRFAELYDFAPVGYITLDREFRILEANLTAVKMFGINRLEIKKHRPKFSNLVARESRDDWFTFHRRMFLGEEKQSCELRCRSGDEDILMCQIESMAVRGIEGSGDRCMVALVDISKREKTQDALLYAGKIIAALSTHDGLVMADASGKITDMNPAALAMFGFGSKEDMLQAMSAPWQAMDLTGPDGKELPAGQWPLVRACAGEKFTGEEFSLFIRPTKRRWYASFSGAPVLDKDGNLEYAVLTIRDISEKKQAEWAEHAARELAERRMNEVTEVKNRLDAVMQTIPVGVAVFGILGGRQVSANRAFNDIWGNPQPPAKTIYDYLQDEASWTDTGKVMAPDERASLRALENGETVIGQTIRIMGFDGVQRVVLNNAAPIFDAFGKIAGCVVTIQDITRQMENEKTIRESEERLRLAQVSAKVGIWDWNLEKNSLTFTPELDLIYGLEPGTIISYEDWHRLAHPDDIVQVEKEIDKSIANREPFNLEFRILHGSGEVRWINAKGGAIYDITGKPQRALGVNIDITERKRMEDALRVSELREHERAIELATVLDSIPTPVFIVHDPGGTHITGNRAADELIRQPSGTEASLSAPAETKPRHFIAMKDGRELSNEELPAQKAARGIPVQHFEFSLVFDDGTARHVMGYGTPLCHADGRPRGAVHVLVDITERKEMEEKLRTTLQRFYLVLSNMRFGILLITDDDRIEFANRAFCDLFGLQDAPEDLTKLSAKEMIDRIRLIYADPDSAVARIREMIGGEQPVIGEEIGMRGDRIFLRDFIPIRIDNKKYGRLWVHMDITERKRAEEAMRESEERYRLLVKHAPTGIYDVDFATGRFIEVNDVMCRILGYTRDEFHGITAFDILDDEGKARFTERIRRVQSGEKCEEYVEYRVLTKDGRSLWAVLNSTFRSLDGNITGATVVAHDITERKMIEEELSRRMEELRVSNEELARFNRAAVDRELRMIELKKQVNELCMKAGMEPRYTVEFGGKRE